MPRVDCNAAGSLFASVILYAAVSHGQLSKICGYMYSSEFYLATFGKDLYLLP